MGKILYFKSNEWGFCKTPCPHRKDFLIGSTKCNSCIFFHKQDEEENIVICYWDTYHKTKEEEQIMTRKEAFNRKSKYSYYRRGLVRTWEGDYSQEQLNYLFAHDYFKDSAPMELLGEYKNNKYYEFTKTGRNWHDWYTLTKWQFFKYKIIDVVWWRCMWHKLRIACGHHYDWQNYYKK